jgi:hypothetical protein
VNWWKQIGEAAVRLGTVSAADLPVAARAAQISARAADALSDPDYDPKALNSLLRVELEYWKQLGFSPQSRRAVTPLPSGEKKKSGFEDVE